MPNDNKIMANDSYPQEPIPPSEQQEPIPPSEQKQEPKPQSPLKILSGEDYFTKAENFSHDLINFSSSRNRKTGFENLDKFQPLYPGLIVIGAGSSLGKTTFVYQLAENLAKNGEHVLFFSLEQSQFELYTKSLSLRTHLAHLKDYSKAEYSSTDIRRGMDYDSKPIDRDYLREQINAFLEETADRLKVITAPFSITVEDIESTTRKYIEEHPGEKVNVVVDYLQIVKPSEASGKELNTRASVDHDVHQLKVMQMELGINIFLVSALNRQSYLSPIDFEAFKESGGIEYTADLIWGLQLEVLSVDDTFNKSEKQKQKRDIIRLHKRRVPRLIELVVLKNRFGKTGDSFYFEYDSTHDYYESHDQRHPLSTFGISDTNSQK